ncbi:LysM peptidoglycan-binding domain-containing protein [Oceanobacillus damuensis]|uniref:LysM peptidoglycan-binding domain-containing protein n=1 Tax=Oceanobacillus damuensis TaxID=937928 RepID=UPI00082F8DDB|nr:LysM peptidoglycan-binding domain-containing protein [Oceanobacillus damuensis]
MQYFYTVQPGDTLFDIARRWEVPLESLIAANNLSAPYTIYIGQQLSIPPGVDIYLVRPGDSVYQISQYFRIPISVIIEANQLQAPYVIYVNQLLKVPPGVPYYVVQPGDTLYTIAGRFNVITDGTRRTELIQQVNQLPTTTILPGMMLRIPYAPPGGEGLIAYTSNASGEFDIWLYNPRNGTNVQLTSGLGASFSTPEWSRDSRRIAFVGRNRIIYVVELESGTLASIDQLGENDSLRLDWSPDSTTIAYTTRNQIILYQLASNQFQSIQQPGATDIQWLPSGTELLYQAPDNNGVSQLYRILRDGTGRRRITNNTDGPLNDVRLSPDGTFVLYTTPGVSISLIITIELATGNMFGLEGGPLAKNYYPRWNPNSRIIAYSATAYEDRGYFSQVRTVTREGEAETIHAISNCFASPVTWSPNGRKIAYLSGCSEQEFAREMWVIDLDHPVPIKLIEGAVITSLQWSKTPVDHFLRRTYTNQTYRIRFQYPSNWVRVNNERYEGPDGFFQVSAIAGESLEDVCQGEAFHPLMPYGSMPQIIPATIQGEEACFIFPSADQPPEMNRQAALIVTYPAPIVIEGTAYNFLILWVDEAHIREIASTLIFL